MKIHGFSYIFLNQVLYELKKNFPCLPVIGGSLENSYVVKGVIFDRQFVSSQMPKKIEK